MEVFHEMETNTTTLAEQFSQFTRQGKLLLPGWTEEETEYTVSENASIGLDVKQHGNVGFPQKRSGAPSSQWRLRQARQESDVLRFKTIQWKRLRISLSTLRNTVRETESSDAVSRFLQSPCRRRRTWCLQERQQVDPPDPPPSR